MRFEDGVAAQPEVLARSAEAVVAGLSRVAPLEDGQLVALVGIGASEHIARGAASAWRAAGLRAVALSATELMDGAPPLADVYVALSESGRSAETVAALSRVEGRRIAVTNEPGSPLAGLVEEVLVLDSGPDSPVYTTGYTATLQAVGLLGEHWLGASGDWTPLPDLVCSVIEASRPVADALAEQFGAARVVDVVGSGTATATAGEGALVLREAARVHTAQHETYNYLHGPMEPLDDETACVVVGDGREVRLAVDVSTLGCPTLLLTTRSDVEATDHLTVLRLPVAGSDLAQTVLQIVPLQMLTWRLASDRGLRVDGFRYHQDDTKLEDQ
ncbi:MAG: SIS domain-containing protein [Nocardioidaceae bacterium]